VNQQSGFSGQESWGQVEFVTRYNLYLSPAVLARGMLGMLKYDGRPALPAITIPTLIIPGDQDPLCPPEASAYIHQHVRSSQLAPLAPARHMGLLEQNQQFAAFVDTFATSVFESPRPLNQIALGSEEYHR
jgi:pimeloyl-ACP methyl ester carboxylesterase